MQNKLDEEHDALTGLLNRRTFDEKLQDGLQQAEAQGRPLSVALLDLDHFKRINDSYGHETGDEVLRRVSAALQCLGETAVVSRYGGEEFAILLPGMEREQSLLLLEGLRQQVQNMPPFEEGLAALKTQMTFSGGVASYPIDGSDPSELLRKADGALYRAKVGGRNKILLAYEERMAPKTVHFTLTQLERLSMLAQEQGLSEAVLLREALDDLLIKYKHTFLRPR